MTNERFMELLELVDEVNQSDKFYAAIERTKDATRIVAGRMPPDGIRPLYDTRYFYETGAARTSDYVFTFGDTDLKQGEAALRKMLEEARDGV